MLQRNQDVSMLGLSSPVTYRRDRFGECWHLVPAGELGVRGRTLCGEPRQGTHLSETYADDRPGPSECICPRCTEVDAIKQGSRS
jgi:hypothetical protein